MHARDQAGEIWGFDVSPFAAELAVINLYRQDMAEFENFPRINVGNFFDRDAGQTIEFPAPQVSAGTKKIPVPIPKFDCVIGNPPYLRSQNQDDLDPSYRNRLFQSAIAAGFQAGAKTDLFAFFIYHATRVMRDGARMGFVTPASWLTSDYAISLQQAFLSTIRIKTVISSNAEAFFPQVDVNAVLVVAEKCDPKAPDEPIRFVTLKKPIGTLIAGKGEYWDRVIALTQEFDAATSVETDRLRIKVVDPASERTELNHDQSKPRNWSKYLRAPLDVPYHFDRKALKEVIIHPLLDTYDLEINTKDGEAAFNGGHPRPVAEAIVRALLWGRSAFSISNDRIAMDAAVRSFLSWGADIERDIEAAIDSSTLGTGYRDALKREVYARLGIHPASFVKTLPVHITL